ncbi:MAG: DUF3667 domain-containing protein [Chitinophagaceae bacterium]|nr:DUF3667 domain-containing protein [Chitinophagaceae bacterium]OQY95428.1 MAG: hypothetical protein B6D37_05405 [Sphingobacteriales bacterium UTBCD1]
MSHAPERKEKDCLNCGATVYGRYCHICGQENIVPKETFWSMVFHFFSDITHFDSKFFKTVKYLVLRPGFLSKEFLKGKRTSYLHPVRMYVFISAFFFLLFFSFFRSGRSHSPDINSALTRDDRNEYIKILETKLKEDSSNTELKNKLLCAKDTACLVTVKDLLDVETGMFSVSIDNKEFKSLHEYDSAQNSLPPAKRDGWFKRKLSKRLIELNNRFSNNKEEAVKELQDSVLHRLPYMLFLSLPLFAFLLKLVYIRRKQFYFIDHGIFTIHFYIFSFLLMIAVFAVNELDDAFGWSFTGWIKALLFIGLFFYLYKAMRNFYGQRRFKTFVKFLVISFSSLIMLSVLFVLFLIFSAATF